MSDLTDKFTALEGQLTSEHTALMAAIADINTVLGLISSNTDLALENGAANTKALLAALGQTGACFPCPTPSIVVPPVSTTPVSITSEGCQRSQWIVTAIQGILAQFDTLQSFNVSGTFSVLNDAISEIVGAIAAGDTIPLPSFPETVNIVGDYVSYAGERLFSGVSLSTQFAPLYGNLVTAVAISGNAADAQAQYNGVIDASSASNGAKLLFKALGYNDLWSYAFDPASTPDLSAFDGTACGVALGDIGACTNFGSSHILLSSEHTLEYLHVAPTSPLGETAIGGDYFGWSFEVTPAVTGHNIFLYRWDTSDAVSLAHAWAADDGPYTLTSHTHAIALQTEEPDQPSQTFTVRICPPA